MTATAPLDLAADIVDLTSALVDVPSETFHEGPLADAVERALRAEDHLRVERLGDNIVARTDLGRRERVIVAGHLDTVPAHGNDRAVLVPAGAAVPVLGLDGMGIAPEQRLYGLGSCDMKGGVAVALSCARMIREPVRDVTYVFYAAEEVAAVHNGLGHLVRDRPEWLAGADLAILMEPSRGEVEAGCQGTLRVRAKASGRRAHSARSWMGLNAVHAVGGLLQRLADYQPRRVDIDGLVYREGLSAVGITGGVAGNVIPDECVVTINYRFAPDRSEAEALAHVAEVCDGFELEVDDSSPGALPGLDQPAVQGFLAATGARPAPKYGWTDVARFSALGLPALNYGPGDPSLAHTAEEHVATDQLRRVRDVMGSWLAGEANDEGRPGGA
ncbi:MAG: hypothetical protein RLZ55_659 [Actinomycetota bacterium]